VNINNFCRSKDKMAVKCDSLAEVKELFIIFQKYHLEWANGTVYNPNYSFIYKDDYENIFFTNKGTTVHLFYAQMNNINLYTFKQLKNISQDFLIIAERNLIYEN